MWNACNQCLKIVCKDAFNILMYCEALALVVEDQVNTSFPEWCCVTPDVFECTMDGRLNFIDLDIIQLPAGSSLSQFSTFTELVQLDLHNQGQNLMGTLNDLRTLTKLYVLQLNDNPNLHGSLDGLENMLALVQLDAQDCSLSGSLSPLAGLNRLERLYLDSNTLTGTLSALSACPNLTHVMLTDNRLTGPVDALAARSA